MGETMVVVEERVVSLGVVVEAGVLGVTGLLVSLAFFLFNVRLRSNRLIKMSSPVLNLFSAGGGILLSVCSTLYGMDYFLRDFTGTGTGTGASSAVCQSRVGLLACGFSLLFGPIFCKSWRVYRLFRNAGRKRVIIKDSRLLLMTGCLLLVDLALVLIWHTTDPLTFRPLLLYRQMGSPLTDQDRNSSTSTTPLQMTQIYSCSSSSSPAWLTVFLALKMALLCYGLFLSWRTRAVALPAMNDSRCIVVSALTTVTMATLTVSVSHVLPEHPDVVHACVVFSIWLCTVVTLCLAFVPKISLWRHNPEAKDFRVSATSTCSSSSPLFPLQHLEEELGHVVAENEALRKSLEEKDSSIRQLRQHLTNAYKHLSHLGLNLDLIQDSGLDADFSSSDSENFANFSRKTFTTRPTSRHLSLEDSHRPPFCGGNIDRNHHSYAQMIKAGDSSIQYDNGGAPSTVKFNIGDDLSGPDSSEFDLSSYDRTRPGFYSPSKERVNISQSGSDQSSQSSNMDGDSPVFVPSAPSGKIPTQETQPSSAKSYKRRQTVPSLRLSKLPRRCSKQDFFVFPTGRQELPSTAHTSNTTALHNEIGTTETRPHPAAAETYRSSILSETTRGMSTNSSSDKNSRRKRHRRRHSANSLTSADKLSELRAAIALDLQRARSVSNVLSNSMHKELENLYRRHTHRLRRRSSSIKSREDLAESIVGSYGLEDTTDTLSYLSSFLPVPSIPDRNVDPLTSRTEVSVLDNDAFYPEKRHRSSTTPLYKNRRNSSRDSGYSMEESFKSSGDQGQKCRRVMLSYQRNLSEMERGETDANKLRLTRQTGEVNQASSVQNLNSNRHSFVAVDWLRKDSDGGSRSQRPFQETVRGDQDLFSVYTAQPAYVVQKGFAQTRALYSTDTYI